MVAGWVLLTLAMLGGIMWGSIEQHRHPSWLTPLVMAAVVGLVGTAGISLILIPL